MGFTDFFQAKPECLWMQASGTYSILRSVRRIRYPVPRIKIEIKKKLNFVNRGPRNIGHSLWSIYNMGIQTFYSRGPYQLLWAGLLDAREKNNNKWLIAEIIV